MPEQRDERSFKERIDPDGEFERRVVGLEALVANPWVRKHLESRGVDTDELAETVRGHRHRLNDMTSAPEKIAAALSPLGWPYFGLVPSDAYREAAELAEQGEPEKAEERIVEAWNESEILGWVGMRVYGLYGPDWDYETGMSRQRLLDEAFALHMEGRYAGAISIALAQMEGIFIDMTGRGSGQFFDGKNERLVDDQTLPGHSAGLKALAEFMTAPAARTRTSGELTRHGIFHGRELGFDTLLNSTKVLAGALALIEWAAPKAVERQRQAAEERNARYAGSKEVDQWGRRLDRRGFENAQRLLRDIHRTQQIAFVQRHRYADDRSQLTLRDLPGQAELHTSPDRQAWWAWSDTEPGVVFGLASRAGDVSAWEYVAEEVPTGGIGDDDRWRNPFDGDEEYPDWAD